MAILKIKKLMNTYVKSDATVTSLGCMSFSADKGEFVAIVGASGSNCQILMDEASHGAKNAPLLAHMTGVMHQ